MTRAIIFDMGNTLMQFVRPGTGSWREFETPGIHGIYQYLIDQGHPIGSHVDDFVDFAERMAFGHIDPAGIRRRGEALGDAEIFELHGEFITKPQVGICGYLGHDDMVDMARDAIWVERDECDLAIWVSDGPVDMAYDAISDFEIFLVAELAVIVTKHFA